jgi:CRISPR-associated protein Csx17
MTLHVHRLAGCAPRPLASYLKALAVLRIVGEQRDTAARGFWQGDCFHLVTTLDAAALERFFLEDWQPSPFVSPWNKGSGFFSLADDKGLAPLAASRAKRFEPIREGVRAAAALMSEMDAAVQSEKRIKAEANEIKDASAKAALRADPIYKQRLARAARECKRLKDELQPECQRRWRGGALRWLRAAVVLHADEKPTFPALLGTGGNDGKLDFTNNAFQRLGDLFDLASDGGGAREGSADLLRAALWGEASLGRRKGGIGQFAPADSGGANATSAALGDSLLNPWDLPLLLEGAMLFSSASTRRLAGGGPALAAAPFAVRGQASGYGSASATEDGAGTRGEQWMPLWSRPWTAGELASVLAEGRCQVNDRSGESAVDVARAIARLGVARGVSAFERYGYLTRNGKSNYAVPLGRWEVRSEPRGLLLDDLEGGDWWNRVRRAARNERAPASFVRAERVLSDAAFAALGHGDQAGRWEAVLVALAQLEHQLVLSGTFTAKARLGPIPRLSPDWVRACDDAGPEVRLALALGGAGREERGVWRDPVRAHWLPLDPKAPHRFFTREKALAHDPRVVCGGRDPESDLIAIVQRRLVEGERSLPLQARKHLSADPRDLAKLVDGRVDLPRTVWLARGFSAIDFSSFTAEHAPRRPQGPVDLDPRHLAFRLAHLPFEVERRGALVRIPVDPSPVRLLAAGEAARAFAVVARRLRACGLSVPYDAATLDPGTARALAGSLAFPVSPVTARSFAFKLEHPSNQETSDAR